MEPTHAVSVGVNAIFTSIRNETVNYFDTEMHFAPAVFLAVRSR